MAYNLYRVYLSNGRTAVVAGENRHEALQRVLLIYRVTWGNIEAIKKVSPRARLYKIKKENAGV